MRTKFCITLLLIIACDNYCFPKNINNAKMSLTVRVDQDSISKFKVGGSNTSVSKYIPRSGTQVGMGSANQTLAFTSYGDFTTYVWINYGFPERKITEIDYGIEYQLSPKSFNGVWNLKVGAHKYIFPVPELNNFILEGTLGHKGFIESDILYTYCFKSNKIESGSRFYIELRKPYDIKVKKLKSKLIPQLKSAYHWGFYGWKGFAHVTTGIKYKMLFTRFSISMAINYQISSKDIIKENDRQRSFLFGGVSIDF